MNPAALKPEDVYGNMRQLLRWLRYLSENPELPISPSTHGQIEKLRAEALNGRLSEVVALLREGDQNFSSLSLGGKLIEAIDKLQRYSQNSARTAELLKRYGIAELLTRAGAKRRLLTPLPEGGSVAPQVGKKLGLNRNGKPFVAHHGTSFAAAQNMSAGALWLSDESTVLEGRTMMNSGFKQPVLYTTLDDGGEFPGLYKGETRVTFTLNPEAIENVDFVRTGNIIGLLTRRAIAVAPDGTPQIQRPSMTSWRAELLAELSRPNTSESRHEHLVRSLGNVLRPAQDAEDAKLYFELIGAEKAPALKTELILASLRNHPSLLDLKSEVSRRFAETLIQNLDTWRIRHAS
ncbi:MAG: hypothetical protein NDJ89_03860 [Oligoflexia bacterium]|nr:hypothetical protein [Oligoflexia bacterium]